MSERSGGAGVLVGLVPLVVPSAGLVGLVTLAGDRTWAASHGDPEARDADARQRALGEGPTLDVLLGAGTLLADDLADEPRWPAWSTQVVEALGLRSAAVVALTGPDQPPTALSLYAKRPGAFREADLDAVRRLAERLDRDAVAVDPTSVLDHRLVVAKAVGVLMQRLHVGEPEALAHLRRTAAETGRSVVETAAAVVGSD